MVEQPCSVDGCERPAESKTMCHRHYMQYHRRGDPSTVTKRGRKPMPLKPCSVPGCDRYSRVKNLCRQHYMRLQTHGDPTIVLSHRSAGKKANEESANRMSPTRTSS